MIKYNIRIYAFTIIGLAFIVYGIIFLITQNLDSINFTKALSHISTAISVNIILWLIFIKWLWKCKIFYPWLVPFPNLSGEWEGTLLSNYKNKSLEPIPTSVKIEQNFFNIQIKITTGESTSYSTGATFDIDTERGLQRLFYSYQNTPKRSVRERSEIHYGTTLLSFDGFKISEMDGEYWTSRETTGEIELKRKNVA
jgi:predicted small integral membrane protein